MKNAKKDGQGTYTSPKSISVKAKTIVSTSLSKWIKPSQKICEANHGDFRGICEAEYIEAKDICRASGGRLPSLDELKKVITDCGGTVVASYSEKEKRIMADNRANSVYQACYKTKGFNQRKRYRSSTIHTKYSSSAWTIHFDSALTTYHNKVGLQQVHCLRGDD